MHPRFPARLTLAALLIVLGALLVAAWWLPNRPAGADVAGGDPVFNSVSFAPYRDGQSPLTGRFPSAAEVDQDVARLVGHTRALRTYAAIEGDYNVAEIAARHGLKLWQGIWLGGDRAQNEREITRAIALANQYPDTIDRVVVGNEVLLRRDLPADELAAILDRVRAAVRQPVTYADVWEFWKQFPQLASHVDIVTIHLLPYWEDNPTGIAGAVAHVESAFHQIAALFPGKRIVIGETGWPSRGRWRRDAAPGRVNQALFLRRFIAAAARDGFEYNFIEAFDQGWKYQNEGIVGANWGIWTADRQLKFPATGGVVEEPDWPFYAAGGIALALGLLALSWRRGPDPLPNQMRRALVAFLLGGALSYAAAQTLPVLYDAHVVLAALVNLSGQALLAALLMRRVGDILAGRPLPPPRDGADATETIRRLLTLRRPAGRGWLFDDLSFVFLWTATVEQLLLVFDARYRDMSLPVFAVPVLALAIRWALGDRPAPPGRAEFVAAGGLAAGALISLYLEGPENLPFLAWNLVAIGFAAPYLAAGLRRGGISQAQPPSASPTMPQVAL